MAECLGLYIDSDMIKYAKVSKDHDNIKIESYGVKQYELLEDVLTQIISETYSFKTSISVNLSDEIYNYFNVFSMLSKKDIEKAIKTEFEFYCDENGINKNVIDSRYICVPSREEEDRLRTIYISANKTEIARKVKDLEKYRLRNISPLPISMTNLIETNADEKVAILNIEDKSTLTIILQGVVYEVKLIQEGMKQIFDKISIRENSYAKAYELCKNTTIYTSEGRDLQIEENDYLEDIMPVLYTIVTKVNKILKDEKIDLNRLYISGAGAVINNIDLYFQENMEKVKCEILKPFFVKTDSIQVNVKEYIEVNSAVALALQGLGNGIKNINFKELTLRDKIELPQIGGNNASSNDFLRKAASLLTAKIDLNTEFDGTDRFLTRIAGTILTAALLYAVFAVAVNNQLDKKLEEADSAKNDYNVQIAAAETDVGKIKTRTSEYDTKIKKIQELNDKAADKYKRKNAIPNLLNHIMFCIPEDVQLTSIRNTTDSHMVIKAKSAHVEQLGYFLAKIKAKSYLTNITSSSGVQDGEYMTITIEGDLP